MAGEGTKTDRREAYVWAVRAGQPGPDSLAGDPQRQALEEALARALGADVASSLREDALFGTADF